MGDPDLVTSLRSWGYTRIIVSIHPWPPVLEQDRWLIDVIERVLCETDQSADELRMRAVELRGQAEESDVKGVRDASLALADRYEQAASARLSA